MIFSFRPSWPRINLREVDLESRWLGVGENGGKGEKGAGVGSLHSGLSSSSSSSL